MILCKNALHLIIFSHFIIHLQLSAWGVTVEHKSCLAGEGVILDCHVKVPPDVQITEIQVNWSFIGKHRTKTLFSFLTGNVTNSSQGYELDTRGLLQGNASLRVENPSVVDDGNFSCYFLIQRVNKEYVHNVSLEVSAPPSLYLPKHVTVVNGGKSILECIITGFYPMQLDVEWLRLRRHGDRNESVKTDICSESPSSNTNHTFSLKSQLSIQGNRTLNHGATYICQVKHRALNESRAVRVHVLETPVVLIASTVAFSVLAVGLLAGAAWIVYQYFHTVPPSVSDICSPSVIYANTRANLKCTIRRVTPTRVDVQWYRVLSSHGTGTHGSPPGVALVSHDEEEALCTENLTKHAQLHSVDNTQLLSTLPLSPQVSDDGGRYRCVVTYKGHTYIKEATLSVKTQPSFLQISSVPQVPVLGQRLVLCCRVERFYPAQVCLEWLGPGGEMLGPVVQYGPFPDYQGLHSVWSTSQLTMTAVEDGLVYRCRVYHCSFAEPGYRDLTYQVNLKGTPPAVKFIKCEPSHPQLGQECTLSLCVENFSPDALSVAWFRQPQGEPILTGVFTSPPSLNPSGLFTQWAFLRLKPTPQDLGTVFMCRVGHSALAEPEERSYTLADLTLE